MIKNLFIAIFLSICICSCSKTKDSSIIPVNIHKNDKNLLGVRIQQYPDCHEMHDEYEGKHPCMIIYVFKNGNAHQLEYTPDGKIKADFWAKLEKDDYLYQNLDKEWIK